MSVPSKLMAALFQSVSTRTAGMNTIDLYRDTATFEVNLKDKTIKYTVK